jgi:hypothetical protein
MRQSEVATMMKKYGHERGTLHCLMRLAEEGEDLQRSFKELAQVVDAMSNVITLLNGVAEGMKGKIDGIHRRIDNDPRSTHAIVSSTDPE